ncbi:hypothetical protein SAMN02745116_02327 [Pilibacter termitis]|uniref:Haloacid dehalogenase-like hydrolase n=1 Tax=Pilibacter termitis TaxID=263852 RepID=A0A1T4QUY9_9ENTE|nr:Cof-type HAD-IIB family hydrolase [Pilibacter termitis]SKA07515.1 hypothetical protein SAMN02745116_02327 [Pilibacter termitis]
MNKKIAFFDIDGTLADNNKQQETRIIDRIPLSAQEAVRKLKANGIEPVLATGRNLGMVHELMEQLAIESVVSSNGAVVMYKGDILWEEFLSPPTAKKLADTLVEHQHSFLIETKHSLYSLPNTTTLASDGTFHIECWTEKNLPEEIVQFVVSSPNGFSLPPVEKNIVAVKVGLHEYDVKQNHVSKATGIHHLLEELNFHVDEAIAFGDEENDFEMFQAVGFSIALGNGNPKLQKIANYVTDNVEHDGIYNACKKFGWIE